MQPYKKLIVVLPCHSLEDFPIHHRGSDAENLLANWTALWHPALIVGSGQKPNWQQADNPDICSFDSHDENEPDDQANSEKESTLALIPHVTKSMLSSELESNLESANAVILSNGGSRASLVSAALAANAASQELATNVDPEIAADFHALGYGFLQVQIMTRQLRYSSNLDETYFSDAVVSAAKHATDGDHEKAKEGLARCFDLLLDEKNGYYPVEPELLDIVLTAPTTLGRKFERQLETNHPTNILMTGAVCERLAKRSTESPQPGLLEKLKHQFAEKQICLLGGLQEELPEPLVSSEATLNQLARGRETFQKHLGVEPTVFMRRRFGLHASLPGILEQFNFVGAIHSTLDDGTFPQSSNCTIRWTGNDDRSLLAVGDLPLSATDAGSFIGLGVRMGEAIDSAHVAAAVFVHWPNDVCESFHDLVRISNYGPLFGSFTGLEEYFETVYDPGYGDSFSADEYKSPFLKQAVERKAVNPISKYTTYWKQYYQLAAMRSLLIQACATSNSKSGKLIELQNSIAQIQTDIEIEVNQDFSIDELDSKDLPNLGERLEALESEIIGLIEPKTNSSSEKVETVLINTTSSRHRVDVALPSHQKGTIRNSLPVVVADSQNESAHWIAEIPAMGRTTLNQRSLESSDLLKSDPKIGEDLTLRNEFFELKVDETTGGIRSIQLYEKRINLASQQLAIRIPAMDSPDLPLTKARYTTMVADSIELKMESRLAGKIISKGKLLDGSTILADYTQSVRVVRGKPTIELDIKIDLKEPLTHSINHYVCSRLAWKDESSRVVANAGEIRQEVNTDWFQATNFMEVVQEKNRLTMLTGGLPFHRRVSRRMVDSLLIVGAEQCNQFQFELGVNVSYPLAAAINRMSPPICLNLPSKNNSTDSNENSSSWLFHFNCKNILATWWEPFFDKDGNWMGVHVRLRETEGRAGKLAIRCPRNVASGEQVNFGGDFLQSLGVAADDPSKLELEFGRFDFFQISIRWKQ